MKFSIGRDKLLDVIRKVQAVIDRKTTSTILSNVLVGSDPREAGRVVLVATDFETSFRGFLDTVTLDEPGQFVVNGKSFYEIVRSLGEQDVVLSTDENRLRIQSGKYVAHLNTFPVEDYPKIPDFGAVDLVEFGKDVIGKMIRCTGFSVSADHSRPNLNGVYFTMAAKGDGYLLTMVSTDGHRLSRIEVKVPRPMDAPDVNGSAILHRKGLAVMKSMLETGDEFCQVGFDDRNVIFRVDNAIVSIRPIEETFPEYRNVIPREFPVKVVLPRKPFEEMIRRVSVLNSPQVKAIRVRVAPGVVETVASNPELGENRDELPIGYDGVEVAAAFNYQFFLETLSVIDEGQFALELIDTISACRLVPVADEGDQGPKYDAMFIIMPMRM